MNKNILIVLSVLMIALFASAVSATVQIVDSAGAATEKVVMDVSYADFDEDPDTNRDMTSIPVIATVIVKNTDIGTKTVSVAATMLATETGYTVTNPTSQAIASNGQGTFTITINVPHKKAPGEVKIADLKVTDQTDPTTPIVADEASLHQKTAFMLSMDEISVDYEDSTGDSQDEDFDSAVDDTFDLDDSVRPGSEITFTIKTENLFDNEDYGDSDIDNIEVNVDADNNDIFEDDFDDKYDISNLKAGDDDKVEITWQIPADVDEDDYTIEFTLEGEDGKNIKYKLVKEVTVTVERENDDVRVEKITVSPVTTCDAEYTVTVNVQNFGSDDQDEVAVALFSQELDIDENEFPLELNEFDDSDDSWTKTYTFDLPKNVAAKTYPLEARVYVNTDDLMDNEIVNVAVKDCNGEETTTTPPTPSVITTTINTSGQPGSNSMTGGTTGTTPTGSSDVIETTEVPTSNNMFIALIVVGGVLVLALIGLFVAILLK